MKNTFMVESADTVVGRGLEALTAGKHHVISGFANWLGAESQRLVPRRVATSIARRMFEPTRR